MKIKTSYILIHISNVHDVTLYKEAHILSVAKLFHIRMEKRVAPFNRPFGATSGL